jgi:hypothetical protein
VHVLDAWQHVQLKPGVKKEVFTAAATVPVYHSTNRLNTGTRDTLFAVSNESVESSLGRWTSTL